MAAARRARAAFACALALAPIAAAFAAPAVPDVPLRAAPLPAAVPGSVRLTLDFGRITGATFHRTGDVVTLDFSTAGRIQPAPGTDFTHSPLIRAATLADHSLTLTLLHGVAVRSNRQGNSRVVDLIAPAGAVLPAPTLAATPAPPAPFQARIVAPSPPPDPAATGPLSAPAPITLAAAEPDPPPAVSRAVVAAPSHAARAPLAPDAPDPPPSPTAFSLGFAPGTGAAALRRGDEALVVFDEARRIDPDALRRQPGLEAATVRQLPQAVVLSLPLPPGRTLALRRAGTAWLLDIVAEPAPDGTAIAAAAKDGALTLAAPPGGHVVTIPDPLTGDTLLIGTQQDAGPHVPAERRFAEFSLLPTLLGVAIAPLTDRAALHGTEGGYRYASAAAGQTLSLATPPATAAPDPSLSGLTRSFDWPPEDTAARLRRLRAEIADAAAKPTLARLPYRREVAESLIGLGMGAEAQAVLQVATEDDPRALDDPRTKLLAAAAALIAGRLPESAALDTAIPPDTDEQALWRALRSAALLPDTATPDPATVAALQRLLPLLQSYPPGLRRTLLPLAADTLLRGGALTAADQLLAAAADDPHLALARAAALRAHGQDDAALAAYTALATRPDRSARARAAIAALDLRLAHKTITPHDAADAADKLVYAWRGDARERDLRLRIADWRRWAHEPGKQLATLRDTLDLFPDPADGIHDRLKEAFAAMVAPLQATGSDGLSPLDLVTLVRQNTDLIPDGPPGEAIAGRLADALGGLDLPKRAEEVLDGVMHRTTAPPARAAFGARLAALLLDDGTAKPALDALDASAPSADVSPNDATLTQALLEKRALLASRAHALLGDRPTALAGIAALDDGPAILARATLHEDAHDWPQAVAELAAYAQKTLPPTGPLDAAQITLLLRLAAATAQAHNEAGLAALRQTYATRLPGPDDTALLAMLTEPPVRNVADLPRAAAENRAARLLPARLQTRK